MGRGAGNALIWAMSGPFCLLGLPEHRAVRRHRQTSISEASGEQS